MHKLVKQIFALYKKHKDFILVLKNILWGSARLRAFKCWMWSMNGLVAGWGINFCLNSYGQWNLGISNGTAGKYEFGIAVLMTFGFYLWLYYDNKSLCNKYLEDQQKKLEEIRKQQERTKIRPFYTLSEYAKIYNNQGVSRYEGTEILKEKRKTIATNREGPIRLLALSGTGKTYMLINAFEEYGSMENVYYCNEVNHFNFQTALKELSLYHKDATVILDNCPSHECESAIKAFGARLFFISAYYDPSDKVMGCNNIIFEEGELQSIVDSIITNNSKRPMPENQKQFIKYHCGNIPLMALLLTKAYNKNGSFLSIHDETLMSHLLDLDEANKNEQRIAMRTLALFQPFDFDDANSKIAQYLIHNDLFTPIETQVNRDILFRKVVDKLSRRNLIDKDSVYISLRPTPLACWLVGEWLHDQGLQLLNIFTDLASHDKAFYSPIIETWARRLSYMQDNPDAKELYAELTKLNGGPFASEDVLCSDFGSRLILAMCTVNPVAIVDCLYEILFPMPVEKLRERLQGDARRNIVMTLERLCFCKDSFHKVACLTARLALAENESWANNSRGQFLQLFHIALAGTECDFSSRLEVIKELAEEEEYIPLLLSAIKGAFSFHGLSRMGGAEKFGFREMQDFIPTWTQIDAYWNSLYDILDQWMNRDASLVPSVADIVSSNVRMFTTSNRGKLLFRFLENIAPRLDYRWDLMHKALIETKNYDHLTNETLTNVQAWIEKLTPKHIITRMRDAVHDMYSRTKDANDMLKQEESIVLPYVKEFVEGKAYLGEEMTEIMDNNKDYLSWAFINNLANILPEKEIPDVCLFIKNHILTKEKDYYSSFLVRFLDSAPKKVLYKALIKELFNERYYNQTLPLMAVTEDSHCANLKFIIERIQKGELDEQYIHRYLSALSQHDGMEILKTANVLKENGCSVGLQFDYLSKYWFLDELYNNRDLLNLSKSIILAYSIENEQQFNNQYIEFTRNILDKTSDQAFAKALNDKLIAFLSNHQSRQRVEEFYIILLSDKYRKTVWDEFSKALVNLDNPRFFLNVRYTVGSGFDFGEDVLFAGHEDDMKQLCKQYPYGALVCASLCPVFAEPNPTTKKVESFHPFAVWLVENYGNRKEVLDEFHSNMNTYHWEGSVVPLLEDKARCLKNLMNVPKLPNNVKQWIELCIKENSTELERERQNDAYMRMAYGKH